MSVEAQEATTAESTAPASDEVLDALAVLSGACARAGAIGYVVIDQPDFTRWVAGVPARRFVNAHLGDPATYSRFTAIGLLSGGEALERLKLMRTADASDKAATPDVVVDSSRSTPG
jgi:hypothetical protein